MSNKVRVGLVGLGSMGSRHFQCYQKNSGAVIVAVCDRNDRKLSGDWTRTTSNLSDGSAGKVDLSGIKTYEDPSKLIADPDIDLIDICLPTPQHASLSVAALRSGKHVLCEKPMARTAAECLEMEQVARESSRQLMIGHCLRYWPHYVRAHEVIWSRAYGNVRYARFYRSSHTPRWSSNQWLIDEEQSGGVVLDMHIHDVDAALWWFGKPQGITADGVLMDGLPMTVDALWHYPDGALVSLHGSWDNNGSPFQYGFKVVMEHATLDYDGTAGSLQLWQSETAGPTDIEVESNDGLNAYQNEIDDFITCLLEGRPVERVTPESSRLSVNVTLEELRQINGSKAG
jgi:predicted dehydrogenase